MHVSKLYTLAGAAEEIGISRQTVQGAVSRGRIKAYLTADGWPLVKLQDVREYIDNPLPPGPKVGYRKKRAKRKR